ncbi:MAG: hypothetical protein ACRD51_05790 [Candidatus Acidiferrum sp.]
MKRCGRIAGMLGVLATSLCLPPILLSQETSGSPKPAAREYPPVGDLSNAQNQSDSQPLTPDEQPLTGVQTATLGTPEMRHSYWVPGFGFGNFIQSSSILNPAVPSWNSTSYLSGNLNLLQAWRHALLNVSYSGGGFFSTDSAMGNGYFQQFGLAQEFDWQRWQLSFIDQFAYLPQSQFGFGAGTNLSLPGIGG